MKDEKQSARMIGSMRDSVRIIGDIMSTGVRWDAEREGPCDEDSQDSHEQPEDESPEEHR